MKNTLPIIILILVVLGCNNSKNTNLTEIENEKKDISPSPTKSLVETSPKTDSAVKIIDFPTLVGKTQDQVKKILGNPKTIDKLNSTDKSGEISFDYEFSDGSYFINFKSGKVNYLHFETKTEYKSFFPLGDMVGLDLRNIVPTQSNPAQITYKGEINNINFSEVRVLSEGKY